jgi:hypothetical protein
MSTPRTTKARAQRVAAILPHVRAAVVAQLAVWDAHREIERALDAELDEMREQIEECALIFESPNGVTEESVRELAEEFVADAEAAPAD